MDCSYDLEIGSPPPGTYTLVLMLREWTGNGYVNRDHYNFRDRVTFPLVTGTQSFPERTVKDNTEEDAVDATQAPEAVIVATVAGRQGCTPHEPDLSLPKTAGQSSTAQASGTGYISARLANIKSITEWVRAKIQQKLAL